MNRRVFCKEHIDILREAGNIGAGNAVTALSKLLQKTVDMSIAKVNIRESHELNVLGSEESYIAAMLIEVYGDINAMLILALETKSAEALVNSMLSGQVDVDTFTELERSVLCETGNILAGAYLSALSRLTHLELVPSVPQMALDMAGAIWSFPVTEFTGENNSLMFIETYFNDQERLLNGTYILVLDDQAFDKIIGSLDAYND